MLRTEDKGIDRVVIQSPNQIRIASSTSIETLLQEDFKIHINDKCYVVHCPKHERVTTEEIQRWVERNFAAEINLWCEMIYINSKMLLMIVLLSIATP